MAGQRRGGIISLQVNAQVYDAKGAFTYNLGRPKREAIVGADGMHGYKETPQPGFVEGVEEQVAAPSDTYRFKVPVKFGDEELIEEVTLRANGRAMQGFKVETTASGGVVFEP